MSFRELSGSGASSRRVRGPSQQSNQNQNDANDHILKTRRPLVLHGRVQSANSPSRRSSRGKSQSSSTSSTKSDRGAHGYSSVRLVMERKSEFSRLSRETQIFGRMVSDLEELLADSGDSPEAAWRARILMRSTQETDKELWEKLFHYEKSLNGEAGDPELRKAQTACMKVHRDFKRIHKSLVLTLSKFETRQKAEISRLGAVGWSAPTDLASRGEGMGAPDDEDTVQERDEEDYFDRAIREREEFDASMRAKEIAEINRKMHMVNNMYNDLAEMVEDQQDNIDEIEEDIDYADFNVQSQRKDPSIMDVFSCGGLESTVETTATATLPSRNQKGDGNIIDWTPLFACGDIQMAAESLKESYGIMRTHDQRPIVRYNDSDDDSPIAVDPLVIETKKGNRKGDSNMSPTARLRNAAKSAERDARERESLRVSEEFHWMMPFETLTEDVKAVHSDLLGWGQNIISPRYEDQQLPPSPQKRLF